MAKNFYKKISLKIIMFFSIKLKGILFYCITLVCFVRELKIRRLIRKKCCKRFESSKYSFFLYERKFIVALLCLFWYWSRDRFQYLNYVFFLKKIQTFKQLKLYCERFLLMIKISRRPFSFVSLQRPKRSIAVLNHSVAMS